MTAEGWKFSASLKTRDWSTRKENHQGTRHALHTLGRGTIEQQFHFHLSRTLRSSRLIHWDLPGVRFMCCMCVYVCVYGQHFQLVASSGVVSSSLYFFYLCLSMSLFFLVLTYTYLHIYMYLHWYVPVEVHFPWCVSLGKKLQHEVSITSCR